MATQTFKRGDTVWCNYDKDERIKGFVKEVLKNGEYLIEVFFPATRDERGMNFAMKEVFKADQLSPYDK